MARSLLEMDYSYWNPNTWNVHFCQAGAGQYPELVGDVWGHGVAGTVSPSALSKAQT